MVKQMDDEKQIAMRHAAFAKPSGIVSVWLPEILKLYADNKVYGVI